MKILVLFLLSFAASTARADVNLASIEPGTQLVSVSTGLEHGLVLGAGYGRMLAIAGHPVLLEGDLVMQPTGLDFQDLRGRAGATVPLLAHGPWKLAGGAGLLLRTTENAIARISNAGADFSLVGGRYSRHWFVAAELGLDWAFATYIAPSDEYRMKVYEDAREGWYGNTASTLRYGLQAGVSLGGTDVVLRGGKLEGVLVPFYATLAIEQRF